MPSQVNKNDGQVDGSGVRTPAAAIAEMPRRLDGVFSEPSIQVVIANYGQRNDVYLRRMLAEFRSMQLRLDLHVLSNVPKDLGSDVTVHVGLPTGNPRSLPFAHRQLFAEHIDKADYFVYCEDDTLISERNIRAFVEVNAELNADEIPGFLRVENVSPEERYVESAHGPYRWNPSSTVRRGSWTFASFTNHHSACTMASRAQIQRAIASGGFLVRPHISRFAMLESAACDLYTQCGMTRMVCLSRIEDFLVPHLSNGNCRSWGLRYEEFLEQTRAFREISNNNQWKGSLFNVETRVGRGRWSKNLYERPDLNLLKMIPQRAKTVLSVGSGWGATEEELARQGKQVTGIPVDAVFGDCLRRRGIATKVGPIEQVVQELQSERFDVILMREVLHLVESPAKWLTMLAPLLSKPGVVLAASPRTYDPLRIVWYLRGEPITAYPRNFAHSRVHRVTRSRLARWFAEAGMDFELLETCTTPTRRSIQRKLWGLWNRSLSDSFIVLAKPRTL